MKSCPDCAEQVQAAANVCRYCSHRFGSGSFQPPALASAGPPLSMATSVRSEKSMGGAAILGFLIAGLGHFHVGEKGRGGILLGSALAAGIGFALSDIGALASLTVCIVSVVDAHRAAENHNKTGVIRPVTGRYWLLLGLAVTSFTIAAAVFDSKASYASADACIIVTRDGTELCGEAARGWCDAYGYGADPTTVAACAAVRPD